MNLERTKVRSDKKGRNQLQIYTIMPILMILVWTVLIVFSMIWNYNNSKYLFQHSALHEAVSSFEKDVVYRNWNAGHGGVYVPVSASTQPNPYLAHIEERDIITSSGKKLTLINPAYMTRQVHEIGLKKYGLRGHITSLKPIRKKNAPDPWEKQALVSFEQGAEEVVSLETIDQSEYLRFMRPFIVEEGCLKCHAQQGYEIGDIRGGISVSVPMAPIYAESNNTIVKVMWGHLILWFLGILGFVLGATKVRKEFSKRLIVKEELQNSKDRFDQLAEQSSNFIWEVDVNGLYTYISHVVQKVLGYTPEELVGNKHFYDLHPEEGRKEFKTAAFEVFAQKERFEGMDNTIQAKDGSIKRISTNGIPLLNDDGTLLGYRGSDVDITEQKQAEEQLRASEERFKSILNTVQAGVVIIEEKTHEILFANPAAATMVQTSIENIVGKVCHEFICPAELGKCPISDLGQKIDNSEKKLLKVDGEELDILKTVNPIIINGKKCLVETFVDITNMKQAEGQLARNMESLREAKEIQEENNAKLVQSMADLERFNDMAVNRELRMIELKKEVNDMLLNKGSDAKYSIPVDADLAEDLP